jgi:hypothetical protein
MSSKSKAELEAELRLVDDAIKRVAFVDDAGQPVIQSHVAMHKHHGQEPYIGCIFCRNEFGQLDPIENLVDELRRDAKVLEIGSENEKASAGAHRLIADTLEARVEEARAMADAGAMRTGIAK